MDHYKAIIGSHQIELTSTDLEELNVAHVKERNFHLLYQGHSQTVRLLAVDPTRKTVSLELAGKRMDIQIQDDTDLLIEKLGLNRHNKEVNGMVHAPMPGLVLDVLVEPGSKVEKGTALLVLEAMKMENVIRSEFEGRIETCEVSQGEKVEKSQLLLVINPEI